jgi:hypothetical protein
LGGTDLAFDLNADQLVDAADSTFWVEQLAKTFFGDVDLDGSVQFSDFLVLSANFGKSGNWEDGDFDGSGDVGFPDFLQLSANFGKTRPAAAAVPEPASIVGLALGLLCCFGVSRKQRR